MPKARKFICASLRLRPWFASLGCSGAVSASGSISQPQTGQISPACGGIGNSAVQQGQGEGSAIPKGSYGAKSSSSGRFLPERFQSFKFNHHRAVIGTEHIG